ncbi:MAG: restriction endonuclease subunit S [Flavobacterium sp.]|nr:MAG: restriction endonuclease subunit S [Flavobacterium sp.]
MEELLNEIEIKDYSAYKDSKTEWLGEIPEHWGIERGKWLFTKQERPIRLTDEIITCFRDGQVTLRSNRKTEGFTNALKEHGYQGIRKGDLVIHNMDAFAGAIGVSDSDGKSTPVYSACTSRFDNVDSYYYAYFLRSLAKNRFIESLAKGIRERSTDFRFNDFGELLLSVPPIIEQTAIAKFLDRKTALIEQAIAIKEKQIELLKERRQILIHKAVTRGLNPNVKMKDSGAEWIGEIPDGWEVKRFGDFFKLNKGLTITKENLQDQGIPCINYGEVHSKYGFEVKPEHNPLKFVSEEYLKTDKNSLLNFGDFVFADTSEDVEGSGNFSYLNSNVISFAGYHTIIARPTNCLFSRFLAYEFSSSKYRAQIRSNVKGVKVFSISQGVLKSTFIWLPDMIEQKLIVEYLDKTSAKIDNAVLIKKKEIEKLKEYKSSLINSAVTGRIKVC